MTRTSTKFDHSVRFAIIVTMDLCPVMLPVKNLIRLCGCPASTNSTNQPDLVGSRQFRLTMFTLFTAYASVRLHHPASKEYGPQMGNYMGPIWATHMGPMLVLQQGFIWDPSGHIHMGPIRAPYSISHTCINRPSHIMHIE